MQNDQKLQDVKEMAEDSVRLVLDQVKALREATLSSVRCFRSGQEKDGNDIYITIIDGYKELFDSLEVIAAYYHYSDSEKEGDYKKIKATIPGTLEMMLSSQKNEDWVSLADYLEYEVPVLLDKVEKVIVVWLEKK